MKTIFFFTSSLIISALNAKPFESDDLYRSYFEHFRKAYHTWDETKMRERNERFNDAIEFVNKHNSVASASYKITINEFSDLDEDEFGQFLGGDYSDERSARILTVLRSIEKSAPDSLDYRLFAPAVRHQHECRSSYAFATLGMLETFLRIKNILVPSLSPQQIIDCDDYDNGCSGGNPLNVLNFLMNSNNFVSAMEKSYPYTSAKSPNGCKTSKFRAAKLPIRNYFEFNAYGNEEFIKRALNTHGPLVVGICIPQKCRNFFAYKSGVYNTPCECPQNTCSGMNHAVVLMGYGSDLQYGEYWIIRNSWGTAWGESGYMRIARSTQNKLSLGCSMIAAEM